MEVLAEVIWRMLFAAIPMMVNLAEILKANQWATEISKPFQQYIIDVSQEKSILVMHAPQHALACMSSSGPVRIRQILNRCGLLVHRCAIQHCAYPRKNGHPSVEFPANCPSDR